MARLALAIPTDLWEQEYAKIPYLRAMRQVELAREAGHEIRAIEWIRRPVALPERETREGVEVERLYLRPPSTGLLARVASFRAITDRVAERLAAARPDAIVCHDPELLPASVRASRRTGSLLFYDAHEDFPAIAAEKSALEAAAFRWIERRASRRADHVYVVADGIRDRFAAWTPRVTTIRNAKPLAQTRVSTPAAAVRSKLGFAPDDFVLAFTGSFSRERGIVEAMEALRHLPTDVKLLAIGGPQETLEELRARAASLAVASRVVFTGPLPVSGMFEALQVADAGLVVYPPQIAKYDHQAPNKLFDYMAMGLAIVASDRREIRRTAIDPGLALGIPDIEPRTVANAVARLRDDPATRRDMGRRARLAFEREHCWERQRERLLASHPFWRGEGAPA